MKFGLRLAPIAAGVAATALTVLLAAPTSSANAVAPKVPDKYATLAASSTPKIVKLDAVTGKVLSVRPVASAHAPKSITVHNPCQGRDACWTASQVPYANFGFAGTGSKYGTWQYRSTMYTEAHSTSVCWTYGGSSPCSPRFGPNTTIGFNHASVTGKKVTNYS